MTETPPDTAQIARLIGEIASHKQVQMRAKSVTRRRLERYVGYEYEQISEDALGESVMKTLNALMKGTSKLDLSKVYALDLVALREALKDDDNEQVLATPIAKYLITSVNRYCYTRLDRWGYSKGKGKDRDSYLDSDLDADMDLSPDEEMEVDFELDLGLDQDLDVDQDLGDNDDGHDENQPKASGARARVIFKNGRASDEFFANHLTTDEEGNRDASITDVDALLLARGVSPEDVDLIRERLSGRSFVEMAADYGGTEDKFRRRVTRALDKAGLREALKL